MSLGKVDQPRGSLCALSGTPASQSNHSLPCFISQQVDENSILRPTFSPGVHTDSSFARERPQSSRKSFSATPALTGSGSLEPAFAPGVPSIMSKNATRTNDNATFVRLSMTIPLPGKNFAVFAITSWSGAPYFGQEP